MAKPIISGIYLIRNMVNGRVYVGSAVRIVRRWDDHKKHLRRNDHHSKALQSSWNKYGEASFGHEILEIVEDKECLIEREQHWIDHLGAHVSQGGYNIVPKAGNSLGWKATEADRLKMRNAQLGKKQTDEHVQKRADAHRGRKNSPESLLRMSIAQKNVTLRQEERVRRAVVLAEIMARPGIRQKLANSAKNRVASPQTLAAMSAAQKTEKQQK